MVGIQLDPDKKGPNSVGFRKNCTYSRIRTKQSVFSRIRIKWFVFRLIQIKWYVFSRIRNTSKRMWCLFSCKLLYCSGPGKSSWTSCKISQSVGEKIRVTVVQC